MWESVQSRAAAVAAEQRQPAGAPVLSGGDTWLVARCRQGDRAAFSEVVTRYKGRIYHYLFRITGNAEDAEDLTQEVFVRLYTSIGSFRAEASLSSWMFRIAGNLAVDAFRRTSKARGLSGSRGVATSPAAPAKKGDDGAWAATGDVPDWSREPMTLLAREELGVQIQAALEELPPKLRSAVVLHDIEGLKYEEIAVIERVPLGTVKSRIFNARAALRARLRPYCEA